MSCTKFRLMESPSPVPSWDDLPVSVCEKASKRLSSSSGAMPGPVSLISKISLFSDSGFPAGCSHYIRFFGFPDFWAHKFYHEEHEGHEG